MTSFLLDSLIILGGIGLLVSISFLIKKCFDYRNRDPLRETIPIINSSPFDTQDAKYTDI